MSPNTPDRNYNTGQIMHNETHDGIGSSVPWTKVTLSLDCPLMTVTASNSATTTFLGYTVGTTTGNALKITVNSLTSGMGIHVVSSATAMTSAGRLLNIDHTGATSISGVVAEVSSAATDETTVFRVTASAALAAGVALDVSGAAITTGTAVDVGGLDALTTGGGLLVSSDSADTGTRSLVKIVVDNTAATGATALEVQQDSDVYAIKISGATTKGIDLTAIGAGEPAINFTDGNASSIDPSATAESGWINIAIGGTLKYVPYYDAS